MGMSAAGVEECGSATCLERVFLGAVVLALGVSEGPDSGAAPDWTMARKAGGDEDGRCCPASK
jgi:hypothetical protein